MLRFAIQAAAAAAVLSGLAWAGLPFLKAKKPAVYGRLAAAWGAAPAPPQNAAPDDANAAPGRAIRVLAAGIDAAETIAETVSNTAAAVADAVSAPAPAPLSTQADDERAPPPESDPEALPEDPRAALNKDPGYDWGLAVTNSFFYTEERVRAGVMPGGAVVASAEEILWPDGVAHRCYRLDGREWDYRTVYVYERDLAMFQGKYADADRADRDAIIEYCRALSRLQEARAELDAAVRARNPYNTAYQAAAAERAEFIARAAAMQKEFETAEGARRGDIIDALRKMKAQNGAMNQRSAEIKKRRDEWNAANIDPKRKTVEIQEMENKVKALHPRANEIVPGI